MRLLVRFLSILTFLVIGYSAQANHVLGGNLTWDCLGGNQYTITLRIYKDCFGASPALASENLFIYPAASCGLIPQNITLNLTSTTEISNLCPSELPSSSCVGGLSPGTQLLVYQATVTIPPGCNWQVIWNEGDWNYFNNINYSTLPDAFINAFINTNYCVDSPVITSMQVPYVCRNNGTFVHTPTFTIPAGVTATYSLGTPQTTGATLDASINVPGYVNTLGASVNATTGAVSINTNGIAVGNYVVTVQITLTQGGNTIGTYYENMVFVIRDCGITPTTFATPGIQTINIPADLAGPTTINACAGDNVCFTVSASNTNLYRAITLTATWSAGLNAGTPVFTQSTVNYNPATGNFCFTADPSMVGVANTINFHAVDNACTAPQSADQVVTVNVYPSVTLNPTTATICNNASVTVTASGGTTYTWSVLSGDNTPGFDGNGAVQVLESISSNTVIMVSMPGVPAQCNATDTLTVTVPDFTVQPLTTQSMCVGGIVSPLSFTLTGVAGTPTYQWYSNATNANTGGTLITGATNATYTPLSTTAGTTYYYCVVTIPSLSCPSITTNAAEVVVIPDPTISTQPLATQTICVGGTGTLNVVYANGLGTATYQWYSNTTNTTTGGSIIAGATNATYTTPVLNTVGTRNYYCIVTLSGSGCGSVTSTVGQVIVVADPTISTQPTATQSICVGGTPTSISVAYTNGAGTPTYQWYSNTANNTTTGTAIAGANSATYAFPAMNTPGTYYYYCIITFGGSGCGTVTSATSQVVVVADATIGTQPQATQTVCQNGIPTPLTVTVNNGLGTITYQWYCTTVNNNFSGTAVPGATSVTFSPPTNVLGTRYYYCRVNVASLTCGVIFVVTSGTGAVIVVAPPTINTQPTATQTICIGGTSNPITVGYTGGTGTASYQWFSNTTNSNTGGTAIAGATTSSYTAPGTTVGTYYYYCVITLSGAGCGSVTSNVSTLNVVADPTISTQPTASQTICVGGIPAALTTAYSNGTGTATYQWFVNTTNSTTGGTAVAGATTATFTPTAINTAGNYFYYGVVTLSGSGCGTATSSVANVVVVDDPSFSVQPLASQSVCVGGTTTVLSVTSVGGTGTMSYQWYSNATNSSTGGTAIAGATSTTYTPPSTTVGTVYYYCEVAATGNGCGTAASTTATVIVVAPPTVSTQPTVTQTICDGGTATALTVAYTGGTGTASYQWYSNTTNTTTGGSLIAGATTASYTPSALVAGTYYYYCVITLSGSSCGSVTSNTATVIAVADPTISTQPTATQTICVGGTPSTLTLAYTGGTGTASYQWYSNTTNSTTGGTLIAGATNASYTPPTLNTAGSNYYYGIATLSGSGCGAATTSVAVAVVIADPTISTQPTTTQTVCTGGTLTALTIAASGGTGTTTYQWFSNATNSATGGTAIAGATNASYTPPTTTVGTTYYYGEASLSGSGCGTAASTTATVIVVAPPTVSTQPTVTQTICDGGTATALTVAYTGGTGTASYQWYSNTTNTTTGGSLIAGATTASYTPSALAAGTYYYYCVITLSESSCGSVTSNTATVIAVADPTISTQPTATQTICVGGTPSTLTLAYTSGTGTASYQWYSNTTNSTTGGTLIAGATNASYTPPTLNTAGSNYYYGIATLSGSGCGAATTAVAVAVVIADPTISTQPTTTQTVCTGGTLTALTIAASGGTGTTTYQWFSNATNSATGGTAIAGATNASYTPPTTTVGTTYYYGEASLSGSGCGTAASTTATVIVVAPPTVSTQPTVTQTICDGGTATALTVAYTGGTGTASYQWYSNTTNTTTGGSLIAGATTASYTPSALAAGTYYYYCVITLSGSSCGSVTSNTATVIAVADPTISTQPTATQTICVGGTPSTLTLAYTGGTGTASYQWYSNTTNSTTGGTLIAGATNASYTPPTLNTAGSNYYYGIATLSGSGCGAATTAVAVAVVIADPTISTQPTTTQTVCTGGTLTALTIAASGGTGTTTYQWFSNATNSATGGTAIAGATNASYTPPTTTVGTTYYYGEASLSGSGCGTAASTTATVIVVAPPTVSTQPTVTQTICDGGTATALTVAYTGGTGTASYQWYSNTTNTTTGGTLIAGATTASYTPSALAAGTYYYYCVITLSGSSCGSVTSNTATVIAVADPTISTQPTATQTICVGGTPSTLTLAYTGGTGTASYQWYSNTTNSTTGGTLIAGATNASYTPPTLNTAGSNYYYGIATLSGSGCDAATSVVSAITVVADPTITVQPLTTQTVCQNGLATPLTITINGGTGTTSYQWYTNITNTTVGGIASGNAATLNPITAVVGTAYVYCVVNTTGSGCTATTSATAEVIVVPIPTITTQPLATQSLCQGGTPTTLTFTYSNSSGTATYQWYSNTANSTTGGTLIPGATAITYVPTSANVGTMYYYCISTLSSGGAACGTVTTQAAAVTVVGLPSINTQPTATQTICVGGTPTILNLTYSGGAGTASYQWYSNTTNATTGGTLINGATLATYTPPTMNAVGNFYYYGVASLSGAGCGSVASSAAEVVVIGDPTISTQPTTTQTVCSGGVVTALTIAATGGTGTASYQWYSSTTNLASGGTLIAGATNASYSPPSVTVGTLYYYGVATLSGSGCGTATSTTGTIVVVAQPSVVTQPLSTQTVCLNGIPTAITFSFIDGAGTPTYQWYSNTTNIATGGTPIAGATNAAYLPVSNTIGTTYYYATAALNGSGCGTATTLTATVVVNGPPTVSAQPTVSQNICEGGSANVLAVAYTGGTGNATYQWYSNTTNTSLGGTLIAGATASTYTPPVFSTAGTYYYYSTISLSGAGCGSVSSNTAAVNVVLDPTVSTQPTSTQSLCVNGAPINLQTAYTNGTGAATYQWYVNTTNSTTGGTILPSGTTATYTPSTVNAGTQYYYCQISLAGAGCAAITSSASEVIVVALPSVVTQAVANETVCVGGTPSTLTPGILGGTGTPSYQWYSNTTNSTTGGTTIAGATNASYAPTTTAAGATYYYLVTTFAGTNCGTATSATSQIIVVADPTVSTQPTATQSLCVGGTPTAISVAVSGGVGIPTYQWYSNTTNSTTGGSAISGTNSASYTPLSTTVAGSMYYYAAITLSGSGCDVINSSVSEVINVADPVISVQPIALQNECVNSPTTAITSDVTGGIGNVSYAWYFNSIPAVGGSPYPGANTNSVTPANNPVGITYYYMVATLSGVGCDPAVSNFAQVNVNALPNITVTPVQDSICFGATTDVFASGAVNYTWTADPSITSATNVAIVTVAPAGSVTYTVQGTDANGCVNTASGVVYAAPLLTVQETVVSNICYGTCTGEILLTPNGGAPNYSVAWTNAGVTGLHPTALCPGAYDYTVTDGIGCTFQNVTNITAQPNNPIDNVVITQPTCFGFNNGSIDFQDATVVSFELVNATTGASILTQPTGLFNSIGAGNYNVIYQDALGCSFDSLNFIVLAQSAPVTLSLTPQAPVLCFNQLVPMTANAGGGNGGPITVTWGSCNTVTNCILGTGNPYNYTLTSDVTLYAQATDANGCASPIQSIALNLADPIQVNLQNGVSSVIICEGDCVNMTASASGGNNPITIEWYEVPTIVGGTTIGPNGSSNTLCPTSSTAVYVFANDGCAVPDTDTLNITVQSFPTVSFSVNSTEGCFPLTVSFTNNTSPTFNGNCLWNMDDGTTIANCGNQIYTYTEEGVYNPSLYVISPEGCSTTYTLANPIVVHGYPVADFSWAPQPVDVTQPVVHFTDASIDAVNYLWEFAWLGADNVPNPVFTFPDVDLAEYPVCLTVENAFGCSDTACRTVILNSVLQVWVPNAYTPEQDGLNEVFLPVIKGANPAGYHFVIFDRWGTLIFESFDIGEPWIGDIRGGKGFAADGTYVWRLEVEHLADRRLEVFTGFVTLFR